MRGVSTTSPYFKPLTGVRALAALLVYLVHINPLEHSRTFWFAGNVFADFQIGVSIFFTLSGFLIVYQYLDILSLRQLPAYFIRRFARVYPLFFLITTLTAVSTAAAYGTRNELLGIYLLNISFMKGFSDSLKFSLVGHTWSLTVEECFYLFVPGLLLAYRRWGWWSFPVLGLSLMATGLTLSIVLAGNRLGFFANTQFVFSWTFFGRFFEFFCGAALAVALRHHPARLTPVSGGKCTLTAGLLLALILTISAFIRRAAPDYLTIPANIQLKSATYIILIPIATTLLFYGLLTEKTWVARLLSSSIFQVLGKSSYAFYLIHAGVVRTWLIEPLSAPLPHFRFLAALTLTAILAISIYYLVEQPINSRIRHLTST